MVQGVFNNAKGKLCGFEKMLINRERTAVYWKTLTANPDYQYEIPGLLSISTISIPAMMVAVGVGVCGSGRRVDSESGLKPLALLLDPHHTQPVSFK